MSPYSINILWTKSCPPIYSKLNSVSMLLEILVSQSITRLQVHSPLLPDVLQLFFLSPLFFFLLLLLSRLLLFRLLCLCADEFVVLSSLWGWSCFNAQVTRNETSRNRIRSQWPRPQLSTYPRGTCRCRRECICRR